MPIRRAFRWPARRTAGLGFLALIFATITSILLLLNGSFDPIFKYDSIHDQVIRNLSAITNTYRNDRNIGLVLATPKFEDLHWVLDYCTHHPDTTPFIYMIDEDPDPRLLTPRTIRGRETAAYLSYIVDYYDRLPPYSIFVHANIDQWHNDLFGPHTTPALENLRLEAVDARGYVNLRCQHNPGCPTSVHPWEPTQYDIEKDDIRAFFPQVYQTLFNVGPEKVPDHIGNVCCGQFAVSRARIRERPLADYERMLQWAAETELTDSFGVGWVFEKVWHIIFGMEEI
ncbi:hypothetical protein HFD88_008113 [Aspergillus terreus]|nr:hypothetical protein HFD88_008113 [Aspergillus terreus]